METDKIGLNLKGMSSVLTWLIRHASTQQSEKTDFCRVFG